MKSVKRIRGIGITERHFGYIKALLTLAHAGGESTVSPCG